MLLSYFTRNSSSPPGQPPTAPTATTTTTMASTSDDDSALSPPPHIIHSPLPSRPSPTQPAHVLDALVRGSHAGSTASPAPTAESSTTSFSARHAPTSHSSTPQSFNHLQPAQAPSDRSIDLLAMLTNAANASQSQLLMPQHPQQPQHAQPIIQPQPQPPRLPADDPTMAGRMILDSLLKYVPFSFPDLSRCASRVQSDAEHAPFPLSAPALVFYPTRRTTPTELSTTLSLPAAKRLRGQAVMLAHSREPCRHLECLTDI